MGRQAVTDDKPDIGKIRTKNMINTGCKGRYQIQGIDKQADSQPRARPS
jgi:hypothetical protein